MSEPGASGRLLRAERAVAGVTESRHDEAVLVEAVVDAHGEKVGLGEPFADPKQAVGGAHRREHEQVLGFGRVGEDVFKDGAHIVEPVASIGSATMTVSFSVISGSFV